jgi:hypothetical protein
VFQSVLDFTDVGAKHCASLLDGSAQLDRELIYPRLQRALRLRNTLLELPKARFDDAMKRLESRRLALFGKLSLDLQFARVSMRFQ